MCMAIPSRVEHTDGRVATVECGGQRREVSLMLLDDEVAVGDYLLVRNGSFACEVLDAESAMRALDLIDSVVNASHGADLRAW
jgi:hydrogenase expression/formation protein HypC